LETWVDDTCGEEADLDAFEKSELEANAELEFNEYLRNAVEIKHDPTGLGEVKFTQLVLMQKLKHACMVLYIADSP
jgi:hypothetical protein